MHITSLQNERIKHFVKLRQDKRQRERDGLMLVEGRDEILLAVAAGSTPAMLIRCPELASDEPQLEDEGPEQLSVTKPVFEKISYRDNPDGWMGVFPIPKSVLRDPEQGAKPLMIVAEAVEKPGNLGAILRTADAAGVSAVLVCDPHTDLYGPNVVRASRGTIFSVPTTQVTNQEASDFLRRNGIRVVAATPSASLPYTSADLREPAAIAVGTEDEGLTDFWLDRADVKVIIPMLGKANSLNVSIATALIVYEAVRQRGS
ncbi:MAG TPA: RNA methyltransferase [Anaerolineales bacterium]|nr:RNA methyltransferase [Anaerolineales bacterium]